MMEESNPVNPVNPVILSKMAVRLPTWILDIQPTIFSTTEYPENTEKQPKTAILTTKYAKNAKKLPKTAVLTTNHTNYTNEIPNPVNPEKSCSSCQKRRPECWNDGTLE
jgi:hypothetical protein